jgi:hypothetical protein
MTLAHGISGMTGFAKRLISPFDLARNLIARQPKRATQGPGRLKSIETSSIDPAAFNKGGTVMRTTRALSAALLALSTFGCGSGSQPDVADGPALPQVSPRANPEPVAWDPKSIEGGYMFRDFDSFQGYVQESEFIGRGVLKKREGFEVTVAIHEVIQGRAGTKELNARQTGGMIFAVPGEEVLILTERRNGRTVLNSRCGAPGLYQYTDDKLGIILACLTRKN